MVNVVGRVVGGGLPARKRREPPEDVVAEVRTRKATPEELEEIDAAVARKYGKGKQEQDKRKATAMMISKDIMARSKRNDAKRRKEKELDDECIARLKECCRNMTRDRWELMRTFVIVAGAVHGWDEGFENAEKAD